MVERQHRYDINQTEKVAPWVDRFAHGGCIRNIRKLAILAYKGDLHEVSSLIEAGAEIDHCDSQNQTALYYALKHSTPRPDEACSPHLDCAQALLAAGADPTIRSKNGYRVLDLAENPKRPDIHGVISDYVEGWPPNELKLHVAAWNLDAGGIAESVNLGVSVNRTNGYLYAPPLVISLNRLHSYPQSGDIVDRVRECAQILLGSGADVNVGKVKGKPTMRWESHGQLPIQLATRIGCAPIVQLLIEHGAVVEASSSVERETILSNACVAGDLDIVRLLVEMGGEVNSIDQLLVTVQRMASLTATLPISPMPDYEGIEQFLKNYRRNR